MFVLMNYTCNPRQLIIWVFNMHVLFEREILNRVVFTGRGEDRTTEGATEIGVLHFAFCTFFCFVLLGYTHLKSRTNSSFIQTS